jgi:hypothetical protein
MSEGELKKLPKFSSLDELVTFFEENDLGDYLDAMPEVLFTVNLKNRVGIEKGLYERLAALARERHVSSEGLVNAWLKERLEEELTRKCGLVGEPSRPAQFSPRQLFSFRPPPEPPSRAPQHPCPRSVVKHVGLRAPGPAARAPNDASSPTR